MKGKSVIPSLPFVGREEEIGFLREVLQRTLNDEGKCIIIEGEIGIGKTRLLKEFRDTIDPSPFQVFSGKGMEGGRFMEPFSSMLSHYFSKIENPSQRITRYIPPHDLSILSHLTPQLLRYYPFEVSKSGEASLEMLFSSLFNFFSNLSNLHPLVIVIDDIHWLGEEALEFLEYLCVRIRDFLLAESYAQRFKTLAQRNNIKEYILEAGLKWFHIYLEEKRMEDAEKELKNLSSFRLESLSSLHQVEILMFQAIIEMEKGNLQDALNLLDSALSICKEKNLALSEGKVLTQRALCFLKKGERLKAREDFERASLSFSTLSRNPAFRNISSNTFQ